MTVRKFLLIISLIFLGGLFLSRSAEAPVFSVAAPADKVPILMYHKVSPYPFHGGLGLRVPPEVFESQMKYLKKRSFHTVSLDQLIDHWDNGKPLPPRPVVITLDDGYEDNYHFAFPILKKYGYTATIFLVYNEIGGYNTWDIKNENSIRLKLLSLPQIREMQKYGVSFQSHTLTHPYLSTIPPETAEKEISESRTQLSKALGVPVNFIAYPYGRRNEEIDEMVRKAGYKAGISTEAGKNDLSTNRFRLNRLRVNGYVNLNHFKKMIEE